MRGSAEPPSASRRSVVVGMFGCFALALLLGFAGEGDFAIILGWMGAGQALALAGLIIRDVVLKRTFGRTFVPGQRILAAAALALLPLGVMLIVSNLAGGRSLFVIACVAFLASSVLSFAKVLLIRSERLGTDEEQALALKMLPRAHVRNLIVFIVGVPLAFAILVVLASIASALLAGAL